MKIKASENIYSKDSYEESRRIFLAAIADLKDKLQFTADDFSFEDPTDSSLVTDVFLLKPTGSVETKNLIVIISGVHGVEGYVGSAIQTSFIQNDLDANNKNIHYLFIHALNPYGFKENRRVNKNNVDLNRNFLIDPKVFKSTKSAYDQLNLYLNPKSPVHIHFLSRLIFILKISFLIIKIPIHAMKTIILQGQYHQPEGLYFGGQSYQYQKSNLDSICEAVLLKYSKAFILDLHTGYGKKNRMHIFANSNNDFVSTELNKIFLKENIDYGDSKNFYETTGNLVDYLASKSTARTNIFGVAFEFGTFDSQKLFGAMESLRRMILENQLVHHSANSESKAKVQFLFKKLFYPKDPDFLPKAISQAKENFLKILRHFE